MGNTNYEKVAEIDGQVIFKDDNGYFLWEHYPAPDGSYYAVPVRLGKTAQEVETALADYYDWNYRAWHGEMNAILKAQKEVKKLK